MVMAWPPRPLPVPPADLHEAFVLRSPQPSDAAAFAAAWGDAAIVRWLEPPEASEASAEHWIAGERGRRDAAVALDLVIDVDGAVAGEVGFSSFDEQRRACLVGYWLTASTRGRGLAAEAVRAAIDWMRSELGAVVVLAECDPDNTASHRVAERAGFDLLAADHGGTRVYVCRP